MNTVPHYWRLSIFYLLYFSSVGTLVPYWALYLKALGFNAIAIGELIAIIMATKIIAPNIWGWIGDHTGKHIVLVRICSLLTVICFSGVLLGQSYLWLALIMGVYSFFWNAALPQFEAVTIAHLGTQAHRYSHIRLWGSIGFIITVVLFGWLFEQISITLLPIFLIGLFSSIWLMSLLVPEKATTQHAVSTHSFYQILKQPSVIALFLSCFLIQLSHGPYYIFYSIYLEDYGYPRDLIGQLWALGVIAEIGVFLVMHRLLTHYSLKYLIILSLAITSGRWLLIGYYVESLPILVFAQLLHAASYALYHGVAMQFIRQNFTDRYLGRAQGLYNSLGFGAGTTVGSLISGYTWENIGAQGSYLWASLICGIAILISWQWLEG
ncbi:MFS transporter [Candidatus Parabeggiatoa sp. HSG14]|uniref:MFS transporter n=1 Tax=Candidatus Parabeggiatoa sp. HSG14 TaxID=3055593 RepID=UPI0025A73699|nr:MFS transporter [Thiotrichales bacterium HSG14]